MQTIVKESRTFLTRNVHYFDYCEVSLTHTQTFLVNAQFIMCILLYQSYINKC